MSEDLTVIILGLVACFSLAWLIHSTAWALANGGSSTEKAAKFKKGSYLIISPAAYFEPPKTISDARFIERAQQGATFRVVKVGWLWLTVESVGADLYADNYVKHKVSSSICVWLFNDIHGETASFWKSMRADDRINYKLGKLLKDQYGPWATDLDDIQFMTEEYAQGLIKWEEPLDD